MRRCRHYVGFLGLALTGAAFAQSAGGDYLLERSSIDGGGGRSSGGDFALDGSIGQPDAAPVLLGGDYALQPGFWRALDTAPAGTSIFSDGFDG